MRVFEGFLMARSSPEKLAQALRANLKRRKQAEPGLAPKQEPHPDPKPASGPEAQAPKKPPQNKG